MAGDAGGRNGGIVYQHPIFIAEPEMREDGNSDFMCYTANEFHQTHCVFVPCKV